MNTPLHSCALKKMDGTDTSLIAYTGKVLLIVNVASRCGLTPQYQALEQLYRERQNNGFAILAFPANDFREQEPGSDEDIAAFCQSKYSVSFPLFSKISVTGADRHPLYSALTAAAPTAVGEGPMRTKLESFGIKTSPAPEVVWNFEKFLLNRQGEVVARFAPDVEVTEPRFLTVLNGLLNTET
ncbi:MULTISPECIES: glutathione peroxidase [Halopseudomonas]|uniref:Glutathione peroxidase n=1 Tax=Halopseudomonas pelagia TaxID=553151 RepID=A0AA91U2U7_9GAMM|nr:glutathione peroxidase [Halopseudomonas pelagia]MBQ0741998.1 glutathione peroxidase [Pseudomonas sp.]PCC99517.1 glutathione peroxidase [Halopseudomonas pelagia]QFY56544.1 glutathione peroxidase [Halopseudomonas pelagia]